MLNYQLRSNSDFHSWKQTCWPLKQLLGPSFMKFKWRNKYLTEIRWSPSALQRLKCLWKSISNRYLGSIPLKLIPSSFHNLLSSKNWSLSEMRVVFFHKSHFAHCSTTCLRFCMNSLSSYDYLIRNRCPNLTMAFASEHHGPFNANFMMKFWKMY